MKIQVQYEGKTIEVDAPAGYLTPEQIEEKYVPRTYMEHEVSRKAKGAFKKQMEALKTDEKARSEFLQGLGIDLTAAQEKGDKPLNKDQLAQAQAAWETQHLTPLKEKLAAQDKRISKLTGSKLERDIIAAAAEAGVKKQFLTPIAKGQPAPIVTFLSSIFGFSEEHDEHFVRNGEDFAYSSNPAESSVPFKTVGEFITKDFVKLAHAKDYLEDKRQGGANLSGGGSGGQSGNVRLTNAEARDVGRYRAAKADADKRGVEIEITD